MGRISIAGLAVAVLSAESHVDPRQLHEATLRAMGGRWHAQCSPAGRAYVAGRPGALEAVQIANYGAQISQDGSALTLWRPRLAPVVLTLPNQNAQGAILVQWIGNTPNLSGVGTGFVVTGEGWARIPPMTGAALEVSVAGGKFTGISARAMRDACGQWGL